MANKHIHSGDKSESFDPQDHEQWLTGSIVNGYYDPIITGLETDIADRYTKTEVDQFFDGTTSKTGYNKSNWDTAYGWGDHSAVGYLTDYTVTENDVTQHQSALSITESQISDFGTYDNYVSWNLKTDGAQRTTVGSGSDLDIVGGINTSISYSEEGIVTIDSSDTTYTAGTGLTLSGTEFSLSDERFTTDLLNKLDGIENGAQVNEVNEAPIDGEQYVRQDGNWTIIEEYDSTDFDTDFASKTTDNLSEGTANLYFTNNRAVTAIQNDPSWNAGDWDTAFGWGDHSTVGYLTDYTVTENDVTQHQSALSITESQISDFGTYDNYVSWNLKTDGVQRVMVQSGSDLDIVGGTNVSTTYNAGGIVTISSIDTTYTAGTGLTLSGTQFLLSDEIYTSSEKTKLAGIESGAEVNVGDEFNSTGTYSGLRAQSTTKDDVGLSGIPNTNNSTSNYLRGDGSWVTPPNTNYYVSGLSFSSGTLTATVSGTTNRSVSLDGRYSLTSHSHDGLVTGVSGSGNGTLTINRVGSNVTTNLSHTHNYLSNATGTWINTTDGQPRFHFASNSHTYIRTQGSMMYFRNSSNNNICTISSGGNLVATGNVTASSDIRNKENIETITNPLTRVKALNGYTFDRTDIETKRQTGVIAQEVLEVLPEAVITDDEGYYSVAYGNMVGLLIEAIKDQQKQIDKLKKHV